MNAQSIRVGRQRQGGFTILYFVLAALVFFGIVSLAVDVARLEVAKTNLRTGADAAARAGVSAVFFPSSTRAANVKSRAWAVAENVNNACDRVAMNRANMDVVVGTWDTTTRTFTATNTNPNAVRVKAYRTSTRGGGIPMSFAGVVNITSVDASAEAVAYAKRGGAFWGIVGLDWVKIEGKSYTDSYDSRIGAYGEQPRGYEGTVASNGAITLNGTGTTIYGDAHQGVGLPNEVNLNGNADVTGEEAHLNVPLEYPPATLPASYTTITQTNYTAAEVLELQPGAYYFDELKMAGGSNLIIHGPVELYVKGELTIAGNIVVDRGIPSDFQIFMVPGSANKGVSISGSEGNELYAVVYAPQCPVDINTNNGDLFGAVIGKTLKLSGGGAIHYDEALTPPEQGLRIALVK